MTERKVLSGKTASLQEEELTVTRLNHLGCDRTGQEDPRRTSEGAIMHHSPIEEEAESLKPLERCFLQLNQRGFPKTKEEKSKDNSKACPSSSTN